MQNWKFKTPVPERVMKEVEDYLEEAPKLWTGGLAGFLTFRKDLSSWGREGNFKTLKNYSSTVYVGGQNPYKALPVFGYVANAPCHASLASYTYDEKRQVKKDTNVISVLAMKESVSKKNPEFVKWVAQQSPASVGVVNKDNIDEILNNGLVVDREIVGQRGALWLGKALRYLTEDRHREKLWTRLMDAGADDGMVAFIGASILSDAGGPSGRTHCSLSAYPKVKEDLKTIYHYFHDVGPHDDNDASATGFKALSIYERDGSTIWGDLKGRTEKVDDGWGGFTEKRVPGDAKEFVHILNETIKG